MILKTYDNIDIEPSQSQGGDYTTGCLEDCLYFKK